MQATTTYLDRVQPASKEVGERLAALVTAAPDPDLRVPHSDWTVREAAAHVVTVVGRYADGPEHRGTWVDDPRALPELNQAQIRALGTRAMAELAARLRRDLSALCDQIEGYGAAPPSFRFHGGELVPADVALGILLGELVVHGWDVAKALRRPCPIDPGHVALIMEGLAPIVPGWVDPADAPPVDAHISGDPAALLLVLYRRQSQWRHIALGRLAAWGRRPWLALTFAGRFHKP